MIELIDIPALNANLAENINDLTAIAVRQMTTEKTSRRVYSNIKPINVRIDCDDIEIAKMLGDGNISAGLRISLKLIAAALKIERMHAECAPWRGCLGGDIDK